MAAISLRRTKDKTLVGLPQKSVETLFVDLSHEERDVYDKMEDEARKVINRYITGDNLVRNYSTVLSILVRLRQVCNALALCPPDVREWLPSLEGNLQQNLPLVCQFHFTLHFSAILQFSVASFFHSMADLPL